MAAIDEPLATVDQLAARVSVDGDGDAVSRAEAALADASALVRAEGRMSWTAATAPAAVISVVLAVAGRALNNPEGFVSETIGAYTYRRSEDNNSTGIALTDAERRLLARLSGGDAAYTVPLADHAYSGWANMPSHTFGAEGPWWRRR